MGVHLVEVHSHLRACTARLVRLVADAEADVAKVGEARSAVADLEAQRNTELGSYCRGYCALVTQHHMLEDAAVFPGLRAADHSLGAVVDRLMAEHDVVAEGLSEIDARLVAYADGTGSVADLRAAADSLAALLVSHLDYEEEQLLPAFSVYA